MCDHPTGKDTTCGRPIKTDGRRCGYHPLKDKPQVPKDPLLEPVDGITAGVAALATEAKEEEEDLLDYEDAEAAGEEEDDEEDDDAPAGGAGGGKPVKTAEQKKAEADLLEMYKKKPLAEMTPAEKDATITFLREFHAKTLKTRAEAQKKTREKNKEKGLTGSGKKKLTPWEAAFNRERGVALRNGDTEAEWEAKKPRRLAFMLEKHKATCPGCEHPHV